MAASALMIQDRIELSVLLYSIKITPRLSTPIIAVKDFKKDRGEKDSMFKK